MKIFLAGTASHRNVVEPDPPKYILESYYYIQDWQIPMIRNASDFLLDSGAFTFMRSAKNVDWNKYLKEYCEFINKYNISLFFELDIDKIIGYDNVLTLRHKLESETGKRCIPVWHKSRGIEEFKKCVSNMNMLLSEDLL